MRVTRVLALTAWAACLLLSLSLVVHVAGAGMDVPIPPGAQLTTGTGYCVSVGIGEVLYGHVFVPLHRPEPAKLDELRVSIANAYRLVALQQTDPAKAAALRQAAENIRVPGDPAPDAKRRRPPRIITCVCTTWCGPDVCGHANACYGGCSNCYACR